MTEGDSGGGSVPLPSELAELLAARGEAEAARHQGTVPSLIKGGAP